MMGDTVDLVGEGLSSSVAWRGETPSNQVRVSMRHEDRNETNLPVNDEKGLTRRELLKAVGAVAATVGVDFRGVRASASVCSATSALLLPEGRGDQVARPRAAAFDLADVRLLEGPFRRAQERNGRYLLQLEPDRLLHNFRVNAGLKPKAAVYGGWESVEPWVNI